MSKAWEFKIQKEQILTEEVSTLAKFLYIVLQSYQSKKSPEPFPGLQTLARVMQRDRKTVQKLLNELEELGWIQRMKIRSGNGAFLTNKYVLALGKKRPTAMGNLAPEVKLPTKTVPTNKTLPVREEKQLSTFSKAPIPFVAPNEDHVIEFSSQHELTCTNAFLRSYEKRWNTVRNWQSAILAFEKVFLQSLER